MQAHDAAFPVIPAKAGIHVSARACGPVDPASAGMTKKGGGRLTPKPGR
ncbi:hypothetical protein GGQ81_000094 [Sphingomonas desiccabilis]|nr:hypothetical protein [Sphingomonas desiccabilis]